MTRELGLMESHPTPPSHECGWRDLYERKVPALVAVLADRERELLESKGPCSNSHCSLHYAHSGPCNAMKAKVS